MTIYIFNSLSENDKATTTWDGTFLADRADGDFKYSLYSINDFFVEVHYNSKENRIVKFQAFKTERLLLPYLNQIEIDVNK